MTTKLAPIEGSAGLNTAETSQLPFRVLVVIPTLGTRIETIGRTIASIRQQIGVRVDILIVAKNKTLELASVANQFDVDITVHPGHISAAVNFGFAQAEKEHRYVAWLGDDDALRPGSLANASTLLERNPDAVVCYGSCDYVDIHGGFLFRRHPPPLAPALLQFVPGLIKQEACLFRLSAVRQIAGLDEKLKWTMDLDLLLRLRRIGPFVRSDRVQAAFCWHSGSLTIANRLASLVEAQSVQQEHAHGISRVLYPLLRHPIRYLILFLSWKISRDMKDQDDRTTMDSTKVPVESLQKERSNESNP